ncbi:hypothetical protein [Paenibacillus chitinolyticus]|uniref:hypothetical protein n=1 Tax=Paenibacillus chitinolyticus TaxID=79263 RepID=UPI003671B61C
MATKIVGAEQPEDTGAKQTWLLGSISFQIVFRRIYKGFPYHVNKKAYQQSRNYSSHKFHSHGYRMKNQV